MAGDEAGRRVRPKSLASHRSAAHTLRGESRGGCGFQEGTSSCSVSDGLGRETGSRESDGKVSCPGGQPGPHTVVVAPGGEKSAEGLGAWGGRLEAGVGGRTQVENDGCDPLPLKWTSREKEHVGDEPPGILGTCGLNNHTATEWRCL